MNIDRTGHRPTLDQALPAEAPESVRRRYGSAQSRPVVLVEARYFEPGSFFDSLRWDGRFIVRQRLGLRDWLASALIRLECRALDHRDRALAELAHEHERATARAGPGPTPEDLRSILAILAVVLAPADALAVALLALAARLASPAAMPGGSGPGAFVARC